VGDAGKDGGGQKIEVEEEFIRRVMIGYLESAIGGMCCAMTPQEVADVLIAEAEMLLEHG
jgi:hypothetical protein